MQIYLNIKPIKEDICKILDIIIFLHHKIYKNYIIKICINRFELLNNENLLYSNDLTIYNSKAFLDFEDFYLEKININNRSYKNLKIVLYSKEEEYRFNYLED